MTLKRVYNLKNQRITEHHENLSKMCICIVLVLIAICGLILATVYIVKNARTVTEENDGKINSYYVGNNELLQTNKKPDRHPDTKVEYVSTSVEGNVIVTSNTAEYTSTTIESPLSTSTMSPKDIPPRFLIVKTVSAVDISNSDYSTAGTTNDFVRSMNEGDSPPVKLSTERDYLEEEEDVVDVYLDQRSGIMFNEEPIKSISLVDSQDKNETCTTNSCKQSASRMLALVNHTAKPCDDFYSYACGGFQINHFKEFTVKDSVLEALPDMSTLDVTVPHKKSYYDFFISCTNYKNGRGLKEVSKLLYDLCQDHKDNLTDLIADIILLHPQKKLSRLLPIFDVSMEVGSEKTMIPTVSLPKLNSLLSDDSDMDLYERLCLHSTEMGTTHKKSKTPIQEAYTECIQDQNEYFRNLDKSIFLLQIFEHLPEFKKKQAITKTIQFIEQQIIDKFGFISEGELNSAKYETVPLSRLSSDYPQIEWNELFERLFGKEIVKGITKVRLTHSTYLKKIFKFYSSHSYEDIKTSILSMMAHDMYIDFIEPLSTDDRYKYCLNIATKLMPDIASMLYLENFNRSGVENVEQKLKPMFEQIIAAFNTSLNKNIWSNDRSVQEDVADKISELSILANPFTGLNNFVKNYRQFYSEVNITENDFISNVLALKQVLRRRMYDTNGKSAASSEIIWNYLASPLFDSPVQITETATIVLPTSLIAKFTSESQKIEEFSTIGFLVAQEISRFIYADKKSYMKTHAQESAYYKTANMYGIQLSKEELTSSQHFRFVDDEALRVTFDAYNQSLTSTDKLMPWTFDSNSKTFYLLTSQQFCTAKKSFIEVAIDLIRNEKLPNSFRVNFMAMNSDSFLRTFKCVTGS